MSTGIVICSFIQSLKKSFCSEVITLRKVHSKLTRCNGHGSVESTYFQTLSDFTQLRRDLPVDSMFS